jgi:protease IV
VDAVFFPVFLCNHKNKAMNNFFKTVFASMIGFILGYILIFFIMIFIIIGSISFMASKSMKSFKQSEVVVSSNSILKIDLDQEIVERTEDIPFLDFTFFGEEIQFPLALKDIVDNIKKAREDDNIIGICLQSNFCAHAPATLIEIRNALLDFKESGKFIYSYANAYNENSYYLASLSDSIFIQPEGMFIFNGFVSETTFFKGMLEKLEIEPTLIRVGNFKSAGESFTRKDMSEDNRKQIESIVRSIYKHFLSDISESRGISIDRLEAIADNMEIKLAEDAVEHGLVHRAIYKHDYIELLKKVSGESKVNLITMPKYMHSEKKLKSKKEYTGNKIALIYAVGPIQLDKGGMQVISSEKLSQAIRKARTSDKIKAIVLRINSPGGSAVASDIIWHEVKLASAEKPVVVSMGDVAASGGYYIACAADKILVQPNTITGSIGVFGMHLDMGGFFGNKLGLTFDRVATGPYADFANPSRALRQDELQILQYVVDDIYKDFVSKVAQGRKMDYTVVDSLAMGRVYSGTQAMENGLVDGIGGINDAIEMAATMAGIENYRIYELPKKSSPISFIFENFGANVRNMILKNALGDEYSIYQKAQYIREMNGVYMLMPYELNLY